MHRRLLLPTIVLLLPLGVCADTPPTKADPIRPLLEKEVAKENLAGGVYLVTKKGKMMYQGAVGKQDIESDTPMSTTTIFRIASMTKPITSLGVMILVEDGKIKLDDPLSKYVPEFAEPVVAVSRKEGEKVVWNTEKAKRAITIHDLLTHTSGISYRFFNRPYLGERFVKAGVSDGVSETEGTIGDNVKRIAQVPLFLQPGSGFEYGLNTDVLGRVIEVASGQTLDAFLRERVFTPLKMNDTYFHLPKEKRSRLASLYEPAPEKGLRKIGDKRKIVALLEFTSTYPTSDTSKYYSGGGGLVSTTHDYQRFLQMMLRGGELDGARILKATTVKQMTSNQLGEVKFAPGPFGNSFGYGFGIERRKDAKLPAGSFAWGGLFHTFFWADPGNEIAAVLMTQLYPSNRVKLNEEFVTKVYAKTPE